MLQTLFGSKDKEKVLQFILARQSGYASQIARFYETKPSQITKQLETLENGGVLVGTQMGRTRAYSFNPRYFFKDELESLLRKARETYSDDLKSRLIYGRIRPRRKGKPYVANDGDVLNEA